MDEVSRKVGLTPYLFTTSDEFISTDQEKPTLMQHYDVTPAGTEFPTTPLGAGGAAEIDTYQEMLTQALGYIEGNSFKGVMLIEMLMSYHAPGSDTAFSNSRVVQRGEFDIRFQS